MSDVKCPYCDHEQEINHDDGYGYSEDSYHEQECTACCRYFHFQTSISFSYEVFCRGDHDMEPSIVKGCEQLWSCGKCDYSELR
jgi:hypothetical protein